MNNESQIIIIRRELQDGTLQDNGIVNGSKIIVTPKSETGLVSVSQLKLAKIC